MSLDVERRIERIEEIVEENNKMLHKIRRKEIFNFWFGILKLMILLGVVYYGYTLIQPFLNQLWEIYQNIKETADTASEIKNNFNVGIPGFDVNKLFKGISGS